MKRTSTGISSRHSLRRSAFFRKNWGILLILLLALLLLNTPNRFDLPVGQRDQAHFYSLAKELRQQHWNITAPVPRNSPSEIETLADYPFIFTGFFSLLSIAVGDIFLLNGFFISLFFLISIAFAYLLSKELTHSRNVALITALLMAFNLRFYYLTIAGVWPFLIAASLSFPALYFLVRYVRDNKNCPLGAPLTEVRGSNISERCGKAEMDQSASFRFIVGESRQYQQEHGFMKGGALILNAKGGLKPGVPTSRRDVEKRKWTNTYLSALFNPRLQHKKHFLLLLAFNFLVIHAHQMMGMFLIFIELALFAGILLKEKICINFPRIELFKPAATASERRDRKILRFGVAIAFIAAFFILNALLFTLSAGRSSMFSQWMAYLLEPFIGFQRVWAYFLLFDGPLISALGFFGVLYLAYKNEWELFSIWVSSVIIILLPLLLLGDTWLSTYVYKFYVFFFYVLAVTSAYTLHSMFRTATFRKTAVILFSIMLVIQVVKAGAFLAMVEPAMTPEEFAAANMLREFKGEKILYINNVAEKSNFREFKWTFVLADSADFEYALQFNETTAGEFDIIFLRDRQGINLSGYDLIYAGESAAIVKVVTTRPKMSLSRYR